MVSDEYFNPVQPQSHLIQRDTLPRPIYEDEWLDYPFPSVALPINRLRIGDVVLVSLSLAGDVSIQGEIKAGAGSEFGSGPDRKTILPYEVELRLIWINAEHRLMRLQSDYTKPGVEYVADLYRCSTWLFPLIAVSHVSFANLHIPVLSNGSVAKFYTPLAEYSRYAH